jgi:hypothetical protein
MRIENPNSTELRSHQIAYYTMLLRDAKSDEQKRFLRTQLFNLKTSNHVSLRNFSSVSSVPLSGIQRSSSIRGGLN